jgi:glyceraldehyde 3-phosphate dehydrogenase
MTKIAIHGFGRIGRSAARVALSRGLFVPAVISDIQDPATLAELFAVDSNYGMWPEPVDSKTARF